MKIVRRISDLPSLSGSVGFVPTMGALHEGHLSLVRASKSECNHSVLSIFVNPLQFGPSEDLNKYPRMEIQDLELAERAGADVVFIPDAEELLKSNWTKVTVANVSDRFEGQLRPGHFDGVATIVCKLFNLIRPHKAYFGEKDRQQCAVIRQMVADLNMPVGLSFHPTVRETDGLALSSRNAYLSDKERAQAPCLYQCLLAARDEILAFSNAGISSVATILANARQSLEECGFEVEYFDLIDERTFEPTEVCADNAVLITAARLGSTRLIDNIAIGS